VEQGFSPVYKKLLPQRLKPAIKEALDAGLKACSTLKLGPAGGWNRAGSLGLQPEVSLCTSCC
jgi:hypothetical protein